MRKTNGYEYGNTCSSNLRILGAYLYTNTAYSDPNSSCLTKKEIKIFFLLKKKQKVYQFTIRLSGGGMSDNTPNGIWCI